jgi:hypothetical protein
VATVKLLARECKRGLLPDVCAKCGQPAVERNYRRFSWHPEWLIVLILVGLLIYIIVALILTKKMAVDLPFCEKHRGYFRKRALMHWGAFFAWLALLIGGIVLLVNQDQNAPIIETGPVVLILSVTFLIMLIGVAISGHMAIRPAEITDRFIKLGNVDEEFIDALDDLREENGDFDDRRREDRRRDDSDEDNRRREDRRRDDRDDDDRRPRKRRDDEYDSDDR